ncbi:aminotransferase class V-fold PLP-dependent enzyme [uncultured Georgenia sp.]|uniref:trans-sulfuration enzyme family protein n=1 Tax=uncultured Georgenia sp. TaxID=378209 RepID=UPI0026087AE8|nr:aminotransferase class V-fold PLP-dependent enzyme [uncultured Georgenia sp.]HLV04736.1 aminotransferase class V-fold PLP-dependent enzyme [Actinomycetaceae bacterium]
MTDQHPFPSTQLTPATYAVVAGRPARDDGAPVNPPVVLSSTYVGRGEVRPGDAVYTRLGTETWEPLEEVLAGLERAAEPGLVFASGMAAVSAALELTRPGSRLVVPRHAYHAALVAAHRLGERSGVDVVEVDIADTDAVLAAIAGGPTSLVWLETPTNPMLEIADIRAVSAAAHAAGALVVVDNTFATPLAQRPLELGADVVVHSVSKYLAGHSDVILGAVLTSARELYDELRLRRDIGGAVAGPWETWLALRGLRTLPLRVERAQENAAELARRLAEHPDVVAVGHPSLPTHPQHERATAQMTGYGSIITLRPRGGRAGADAIAAAVRLWVPATSLGGVESSLERRRRFDSEAATVPEDLLRLSVGVEDVEDLWSDLVHGLAAAAQV